MTGQRDRRQLGRPIKNGLLVLVAILVVLLVSGLIYQAVGAAADARNYPPPGQLVSVGDYRLHLYCTGAGSPTVILDTLSGGTSANWGWIQPEVAQTTRVCAYDRAGRGWSDPGIPASDLWTTAENLHTLLQNGAVEPPYVLVGHSIGGLYARAFNHLYPDEVAGLVLVDAAHPEQLDRYPTYQEQADTYARMAATFPAMARVGLFRLYFASDGEIDFQDLPPQQHAELVAFWSSPAYHQSVRSELLAAPTIYAQAHELASLGDRPLAVVSAGINPSSWATLQAELAALSANSNHLIIEDGTHASLAFKPEHAHQTSAAILQVVEAVGSGR
jgi:pimeloyl-ACP methyl ester carboxylesterase